MVWIDIAVKSVVSCESQLVTQPQSFIICWDMLPEYFKVSQYTKEYFEVSSTDFNTSSKWSCAQCIFAEMTLQDRYRKKEKITKLLSICICCFPAGTKVHRLQPRKFVAKIFSELPRDAADSLHTWDLPSPINNNFRFSYFLREGTRNSAKMVWPLWSGLVNQQKVEWLTG